MDTTISELPSVTFSLIWHASKVILYINSTFNQVDAHI